MNAINRVRVAHAMCAQRDHNDAGNLQERRALQERGEHADTAEPGPSAKQMAAGPEEAGALLIVSRLCQDELQATPRHLLGGQ